MKLTTSWLLPAFIATASATSDASVYILQQHELPKSSNTPTLSPEQARLVIAQRLGASRYHSLKDSSETTLGYINQFGGVRKTLFEAESELYEAEDVVVVVEGASPQDIDVLSKVLPQSPDFQISPVPSMQSNKKLVEDIYKQVGQKKTCPMGHSSFRDCWTKGGRVIHYYDITKDSKAASALVAAFHYSQSQIVTDYTNLLVVLIPANANSKSNYGTYEMPNQASLGRRQFEEPMSYSSEAEPSPAKKERVSVLKSNSSKPITGIPPVCYATLDSCTEKTNGCSGHGKCYKKRGEPSGKGACFACGCSSTNQTFTHGPNNRTGQRLIYWGGAACQKQDVSGPFWLLAIFTVVLVGLITWSIGLMYSVGEEKLPGVIGAGVSNNRAR